MVLGKKIRVPATIYTRVGGYAPPSMNKKNYGVLKGFSSKYFCFWNNQRRGHLLNAVQGQFTKMLGLVHIQARHHWVSIWLGGGEAEKNL